MYPCSAIIIVHHLLSNLNFTLVISQGTQSPNPPPLSKSTHASTCSLRHDLLEGRIQHIKPKKLGPKDCTCFDFLSLQVQKEQYLNYRRAYFKENSDVFASNSKDPSKTSK